MKTVISLLLICFFCHGYPKTVLSRLKRDAVGSLDIVTNNASPIHADVNSEVPRVDHMKPCSKNIRPSNIEPGVVFQVLPPKGNLLEVKSLRKSYPLTSQLDLIRGISRAAALAVIIFSAAVEFYPVVINMFNSIYDFFNFNKY